MGSVTIGNESGGGTALLQQVLFPYNYPPRFELNGETFVRTGEEVSASEIDPSLLPFMERGRRSSAVDMRYLGAQSGSSVYTQNSLGIANSATIIMGALNQICRSTDFGKTWTRTTGNLSANQFYVGAAGDGAGVWHMLTSSGALLRSTDDGVNWSTVSGVAALANHSSRVVFLGNGCWVVPRSGNQVWRSSDNGVNWTSITLPGLADTNSTVLSISGAPTGVAVIQLFNNSSGMNMINYHLTTDRGATWSQPRWFDGTAATTSNKPTERVDVRGHSGSFAFGINNVVVGIRSVYDPAESSNNSHWRQLLVSRNNGTTFSRVPLVGIAATSVPSSWDDLSGSTSRANAAAAHGVVHLRDNLFLVVYNDTQTNGNNRADTAMFILEVTETVVRRVDIGVLKLTPPSGVYYGQSTIGDLNAVTATKNPTTDEVFLTIIGQQIADNGSGAGGTLIRKSLFVDIPSNITYSGNGLYYTRIK